MPKGQAAEEEEATSESDSEGAVVGSDGHVAGPWLRTTHYNNLV
jgi:hypothetical protein